jgi:hypothetical protein
MTVVPFDAAKIRARGAQPGTTVSVPDSAPGDGDTISDELSSHWLPAPARDWVDAVSAFAGVPKTMAIAAALCAAATVVQGKVSVEFAPGVTVPLTLWWVVLARTGGRKSTILNAAMAPIKAMQANFETQLRQDINDAKHRRETLKAQIARLRRSSKASKYTEAGQQHLQELRELEHDLDACEVPVVPRWTYDNVNPAMLPMVLQRSQEAEGIARIAIWGEEGTFIANVAGRDSGKPMAETLNQGYSGSPLSVVRKLEGSREYIDVNIPATFISMCVFTQPHYRDILKNQQLADNGFLGRLMVSECHVGPLPEPDACHPPSESVLKGYSDWLVRLANIPAGTVHRLSDAQMARLRALQRETDSLCMAGGDGQGWAMRSAERIARIVALCELDAVSQGGVTGEGGVTGVTGCHGVTGGPANGVPPSRDIDLEYLIYSIYSRYLEASQALEPAPPSLSRDPLVTLGHLVTAVSIGDIVTSRQLCRMMHWRKGRMLAAAYQLVEMGILEVEAQPIQRGTRVVKEVFRVARLSMPESDQS